MSSFTPTNQQTGYDGVANPTVEKIGELPPRFGISVRKSEWRVGAQRANYLVVQLIYLISTKY
ncbi:predicted protein [Botrytis cinerea T4]|uniref:Uncharacterized protein n=1 Tax=Botryotinia fuckeliana (strain T4) TaxID=999810 RepID=G2YTM9_BOTF4|nr:predicted protein [Botrytis cinerea T4]